MIIAFFDSYPQKAIALPTSQNSDRTPHQKAIALPHPQQRSPPHPQKANCLQQRFAIAPTSPKSELLAAALRYRPHIPNSELLAAALRYRPHNPKQRSPSHTPNSDRPLTSQTAIALPHPNKRAHSPHPQKEIALPHPKQRTDKSVLALSHPHIPQKAIALLTYRQTAIAFSHS
ncbi:hypothetical protein IQ226_24615 [Dolichospermum sp. LEGE 00240]|uniref:hypothetical protein n=1 Tax=Dolichospermum sp. LEGE 00240 TaxID=1828603 RepID=UPI00188306A9|nr:hypothetical protein [Dolichospermum sp. LEGE 00240]MBE9252215.1 hypothetical protein [Dolichospermum sp. LEGE 00240]